MKRSSSSLHHLGWSIALFSIIIIPIFNFILSTWNISDFTEFVLKIDRNKNNGIEHHIFDKKTMEEYNKVISENHSTYNNYIDKTNNNSVNERTFGEERETSLLNDLGQVSDFKM